jgi:lipoate-protein ligase A
MKQSQLIYHALGTCGEESIVICIPQEQYSCVGFAQDTAQELDLGYCEAHGIGVFRREIGGGTVFLDENQLFYQVIVDREKAPMDQRVLFRKYLAPVLYTYKSIGIDAKYHPVSDLVVNGKKISGNGGGDIGSCKVMTGSILLDFDYKTMCRLLKLPSEEFRADVYSAMKNNLTTVKNELGLITEFENMFGVLEKSELDKRIIDTMAELDDKYSADNWLYRKMKHPSYRSIKIFEGYYLIFLNQKGVELCLETKAEEISKIKIYSSEHKDLKDQFKNRIVGKKFHEQLVLEAIDEII